eukprot:10949677-Ditylum_brightwellii.AAC.1
MPRTRTTPRPRQTTSKPSTKMPSPTFNIAITTEENISALEGWTEQITKEEKVQFVDERNCHCTLCNVKIKQREVEICVDCQEVLCN